MKKQYLVATALASLLLAGPALAQDDQKTARERHENSAAEKVAEGWAAAPVEEREVKTSHSVEVDGQTINYDATAGTLTLRNDEGKPTASIFYVAYTKPRAEGEEERPLTFFFNGGPGSASLWLHMGSFAPVRVPTEGPEITGPPPYDYGPNPYSLIDKTDMVFIDMVGAGYSRMLGDAKGEDFWGVDQDVDAFARAIMRYVTKNDRWNAPKFIFGESYGTTRAGALAYQLQDRGMDLNGVILLSSVLNYGIDQSGYDRFFISMLPSYAATAWYHEKVEDRPEDVADFIQEAREFAQGPYAEVLAKGHFATDEEIEGVAERMSELTGLSEEYIKQSNLRVDLSGFRKELLRDERKTIGRFDSRYMGVDPDASGARPDFDPSSTAISGAYIASLRDHLGTTLGYETPMQYRIGAYGLEGFDWDWTHRPPGSNWPQSTPDVGVDLSAAMRTNPNLKILSLNGYYDMATPFFATEYDLSHLMMEPNRRDDIRFEYYPSGHMIYLNPDAMGELRSDVADFYADAAP